ncbi:MAG: Spy/CpxP family protein refolding chaperone [Gammaproteobacteria bacterium]|jgi:Spy/CpxP family protein refolding chaperone
MKMKANITALLLLSAIVFPLQTQAMPPWMDGGQGPGMQGGCGMMGPGMMMGSGAGYGMMGAGHMMGGFGMMGGGMMGMPGMMMGGYGMLDLSDKQMDQLNDIQTKLQKDQWQLMGKMLDEQANVRKAWSGDKPDPKKVGAAYAEISKLQRQALEARVEAMNKMYDTLTDEQREQLKSGRRGMWGQMGSPMHRGGRMMMQ